MLSQNNDLKKPLIKTNKATKKLKSDQHQQQKKPMLRIPSKNAHDQKDIQKHIIFFTTSI